MAVPRRHSPKAGLPIGASLDDLGKGLRSQTGTMFGTKAKGTRYLEMTEAMSPAWHSMKTTSHRL